MSGARWAVALELLGRGPPDATALLAALEAMPWPRALALLGATAKQLGAVAKALARGRQWRHGLALAGRPAADAVVRGQVLRTARLAETPKLLESLDSGLLEKC